MPSIACPRCGSPVLVRRWFNLANKPFCARCGWNLDRAEAVLNDKSALVKFLPLGIAALILVFIFLNARANTPIMFVIPGIFLLVVLLPIANYYSTRKAIAAAKFTVNPVLAQSQPPLDPSLQILQSLPRPRRVKLRFSGNSLSVLIVFAAIAVLNVIMFVAISRSPRHPGNNSFAPLLPLLFVMLVFVAIVLVPFFRDRQNLALLRDGELAFARVVSQRTIHQGKASYSSIDYQFKTNDGLQIRSTARDLTNAVFEEMTIPVFYNPGNPDKNVTPCATYLRVSTDPL